jgi:endonuclease/exonuclease/phosphatase family metal-dependent hydrolase
MKPETVTLCSYNIHGAVGRDGRLDPARVASVIEETDADIVALQEVEHHEVDGTDLPAFLARCGNYQLYPGPTLMRGRRLYGNALLTRAVAATVRHLDLSIPRREPRGAIDIELHTARGILRVINTHLGLRPGERRRQVMHLLTHIDAFAGSDVTVLTGDINEWFLWGRPVRWLSRHFRRAPAPATFPAGLPLLALDRIWITPRSRLRSLHRHDSPTARRASDHLPLCARLSLSPQHEDM